MSRVDRRLNRMSVPSAGHGGKAKRAMGVQQALEWAFRIEQAQLELPLPENMTEEGFGFGLEYVLLQRAALGCKVDGGQHKISGFTHEDAEVIAATVAGLADSLGGKRMANQAITPAPLSNGRIDHLRSSSPHSAVDTSPGPRSGTICTASKPGPFVGPSTSSSPDIHASSSAQLANAVILKTSSTSGPRSPVSSVNGVTNRSFSKTSPITPPSGWKPCFESFRIPSMRGALSPLLMTSGPWIWRPACGAEGLEQINLFGGMQP
jgi:hypothetical protein